MTFDRCPRVAAGESYDLIVVGGGIYGVTLTLEASRRGLRPLLLERGDFGEGTSWNSLRILHGGLRYLQTLDLKRFRESVAERSWFLRHFPDLVEPLPCLMPLYGHGLRRPSVLRVAMAVNDWLSRHRNRGVPTASELPDSRILDVQETAAVFPVADRQGLQGGALWFDAVMPSSSRILIELLRWARHLGASALNYVEARDLLTDNRKVVGIRACDTEAQETFEFRAPVVINCAGPACRALTARWDRDIPRLFYPALAFNLLFDRDPPSEMAIAATPRGASRPTYFMYPLRGRLFAGTYHVASSPDAQHPEPADEHVEQFVAELNQSVPALELQLGDIVRTAPGLMPVASAGDAQPATRGVIHVHGENGGPSGLFSVSGVKYTTARRVADKALVQVFGDMLPGSWPSSRSGRPQTRVVPDLDDLKLIDVDGEATQQRTGSLVANPSTVETLRRMAEEETVVHLDDLILRRADWGWVPDEARAVASKICQALGWEQSKRRIELERLDRILARATGVAR